VLAYDGQRAVRYNRDGAAIETFGHAIGDGSDKYSLWDLAAMAVDPAGNRWFADNYRCQVYAIKPDGTFLKRLDDDQRCGRGDYQFRYPSGLAFDSRGYLFVSDGARPYDWNTDVGNHRIQVYNPDGSYLTTIGTPGSFGSTPLQFRGPRHIAVYGDRLYVADSGNQRVQIINISNPAAPTFVAQLGVTGQRGADNAHFSHPYSVAVSDAYIFVADYYNHRVQVFDRQSRAYITTIARPGADAIGTPTDVVVDGAGQLHIADMDRHRVLTYEIGTWNFVRQLGETDVPFRTDYQHIYWPEGIALTPDGGIYVADGGNGDRLYKLDASGRGLWQIGRAGMNAPEADVYLFDTTRDVAAGQNYVYVVGEAGYVRAYTHTGAYAFTIGYGKWDRTQEPGRFNDPQGIGLAFNGDVLVTDSDNGRVQRFTAAGTYIGTPVSGLPYPYDVAGAPDGSFWVSDATDYTVRNYTADGTLRLILGTPGVSGADWDHFRRPEAIDVDAAGRVYVLDVNRPALRIFAPDGKLLADYGGGGQGIAQIDSPKSLAVSPDGTLYIGEMGSSRIEVFKPGLTGWTQLALPGFNHPCNQTDTLESFNGALYAGTYCRRISGISNQYARIFRYDAAAKQWTSVTTAGLGDTNNIGVDDLEVHNGMLYAGTWNWADPAASGMIYRSADGTNWSRVPVPGLAGVQTEISRLMSWGGKLYAATWTDYFATNPAEVWACTACDGSDWAKVLTLPTNSATVWGFSELRGNLCVGTVGFVETPRADLFCSPDGTTWTPWLSDGGGAPTNFRLVGVVDFDGALWAQMNGWTGTKSEIRMLQCRAASCVGNAQWQPVTINLPVTWAYDFRVYAGALWLVTYHPDGVRIYRSSDGLAWESVLPEAGFGNGANSTGLYGSQAVHVFEGKLVVGTTNSRNGGSVFRYEDALETTAPTTEQTAMTLATESGAITWLVAPAGAFTSTVTLSLEDAPLAASAPTGWVFAGRTTEIRAQVGGVGLQPVKPLAMTLTYDPAALGMISGATLTVRRWDGSTWTTDGVTVDNIDTTAHTVTVSVTQAGQYALFVQGTRVTLPVTFMR
jgi:hypothetical protein